MTDGPPVEVLPRLEPDDRVLLFFDRYEHVYEYKPDSPLETTVLDVTTERISGADGVYPGTLTKVFFEVPESDEKATDYWMEHRVEEQGDTTEERASMLLYEEDLQVFSSSGSVGNVDRIEVVSDE